MVQFFLTHMVDAIKLSSLLLIEQISFKCFLKTDINSALNTEVEGRSRLELQQRRRHDHRQSSVTLSK